MVTEQWIKKLGGHAGELYVAAELSKRAITTALLPENFSDDDIIIGKKGGETIGFIQVKSCHSDRGRSFHLSKKNEKWANAKGNEFVVLVYLGSPTNNEITRYWIAKKLEVGAFLKNYPYDSKERRIYLKNEKYPLVSLELNEQLKKWENQWKIFDEYLPR